MRHYSLLASRSPPSSIFCVPLRIHDSFVYFIFSMVVRPSNDSTVSPGTSFAHLKVSGPLALRWLLLKKATGPLALRLVVA